jgi:hypothetical protein
MHQPQICRACDAQHGLSRRAATVELFFFQLVLLIKFDPMDLLWVVAIDYKSIQVRNQEAAILIFFFAVPDLRCAGLLTLSVGVASPGVARERFSFLKN